MRFPLNRRSRAKLGWSVYGLVLMAGSGVWAGPPPRSLLLITIDTLRADHLSCNGAQGVATPNLDRLAREGANFTRARACVPLTLPSHASILTGNYPPTHGVRDNASTRLPASQQTLGEVLQSGGYETVAFLGSFVLDRRFGLAQGFDTYDDRVSRRPEDLESLEAERSAEDVFSAFDSWFSARETEKPFFAWLHFYDPHAPYTPPEPFAGRYRTDPYAGEVAYVDEVIGRVVGRLEAEGVLRSLVIAVVGDHGEGLGEHGERTHSLLIYNSTLHVPMILVAAGQIEPGRRIDSLVRTIDLAPTLLELLGLPGSLGEGRSLLPLLDRGSDSQGSKPGLLAYSESLYAELNLGWSSVYGLETEAYRLILGPEPELYDMRADPGEERDLADAHPATVKELNRQLDESMPSGDPSGASGDRIELDPESMEQLRSLGYMAGSSAPGVEIGEKAKVSPRHHIGDWELIEEGLRHYAAGEFERSAQRFESVLESHPGTTLLYEYLGSSYERMGSFAEAQKVYRRALDAGLQSSEVHLGLARISIAKGEGSVAEKELLAAIELDPMSVVGHHTLGDLYRSRQDLPNAERQYRAALDINPSYVYAWNGLGMTLGGRGDDAGALLAFQRAVAAAPESPLPYMNLAVQLERMGRTIDARTAYQYFLSLAAGHPDLARERTLAETALKRLAVAQ